MLESELELGSSTIPHGHTENYIFNNFNVPYPNPRLHAKCGKKISLKINTWSNVGGA